MEKVILRDNNINKFMEDIIKKSQNGHNVIVEMYGYKKNIPANLSSSSIRVIILNTLNTIKNISQYKRLLEDNTDLTNEEINSIVKKGPFELADACFEYGLTNISRKKTL